MGRGDGARKQKMAPAYRKGRWDFLWNNRVLWTVGLLAVAAALSVVKPVVLSSGGSVTYFSLFFLWLVTFFFGPKHGFVAGFVFGFMKLLITYLTGEYVNFNPCAVAIEYPIACALFALGALALRRGPDVPEASSVDGAQVSRDGFGLRVGYLVGVVAMGVCYVLSALLFYPPEADGFFANLFACTVYDMSYLLIEAAITMLVLCIPQVADAVFFLKHVATTEKGDPTLKSF